jgi:hypothetical protein
LVRLLLIPVYLKVQNGSVVSGTDGKRALILAVKLGRLTIDRHSGDQSLESEYRPARPQLEVN